MQILFLLGAVIIAAAIGLIFTTGGAEKNSGLVNFLNKLKSVALGGMGAGNAAERNAEKYEKSEDGKVVYAFKEKEDAAKNADTSADGAEEREDLPDEDA